MLRVGRVQTRQEQSESRMCSRNREVYFLKYLMRYLSFHPFYSSLSNLFYLGKIFILAIIRRDSAKLIELLGFQFKSKYTYWTPIDPVFLSVSTYTFKNAFLLK